jgi:hypothetical protein
MFGHQIDEKNDSTQAEAINLNSTQSVADNTTNVAVSSALGDDTSETQSSDTQASEIRTLPEPPVQLESESELSSVESAATDSASNFDARPRPLDATVETADGDLLDIKKQALEELSPLVDHLDQTAEERFETTMMMIQANDNEALIPTAYKAANAITDDKKRARALLDIVNEINYFTHKG